MLTAAFLLASSTAAFQVQQSTAAPIVVTGRRLQDTEKALSDCLARRCSVKEDIDASLAHSENLLVAGDYRGARAVLSRSLRRHRDEARTHPEPVADLYRANALVASHLGYLDDYWRSTYSIERTLKAGIPTEDHRHLQAKMEIAAMSARVRGADSGRIAYAEVARAARRQGRQDIAGMAEVRSAMLTYKQSPSAGKAQLRRIMDEARDEPFVSRFAKAFYARILRAEGRTGESDRLLREALPQGTKPTLIFSPPFELAEQETDVLSRVPAGDADLASANVIRRPSRDFEQMWIDVSFLVQSDGRVTDVDVVRSEKDIFWAKPLLKSISGRRYTAFAGQSPYPKLERYTYTAAYDRNAGTRMAVRSPTARVEYLDLMSPSATGSKR